MKFYSATLSGVEPIPVEIEIDLSPGLPFFQIVGLPDEVLKESKTRVKSAIMQSEFDFPYDARLVLNLAPSKLKKEGSGFELSLAASILQASGQIQGPPFDTLYLGELALDGTVKAVDDIEALAFATQKKEGIRLLVVPEGLAENLNGKLSCPVLGIGHLKDLTCDRWWERSRSLIPVPVNKLLPQGDFKNFYFSDFWAWHLRLAAIGRLNYYLCGPPGCGKTFFAESLKALRENLGALPKDSVSEVLNFYFKRQDGELPWASPHHSSSQLGLVGGGRPPKPGAVTKSHGGILFLDELLEFSPATLDALREPFERGKVEISRAGYQVVFPSQFQLIAATNPCRCGFWRHTFKSCDCTSFQRRRYQSRLSGPLLERFDVKLFCKPPVGSESQVSGGALLKATRQTLNFLKTTEVLWSEDAESLFNYLLTTEIKSHRIKNKIRKLAPLIAAMDFQSQVLENHVKTAQELLSFCFEEEKRY